MSDDGALLAAWRGGDLSAGEQLFSKHVDRVSRFFYNKVSEGIDDLVQQTFLACVESADRFRGDSSFRTFLLGVARNMLRRHYEKLGRGREFGDLDAVTAADLSTTPSMAVARVRDQRLLLESLRRIPVDSQIALELYYWEDLNAREIAEVLEVPIGTVKTRLRRAKTLLREQVEQLTDMAPMPATQTIDNLEQWARSIKAQLDANDS
ncbi:MAG: sigma-70 family RNA polymerase sigma factor [Myxococcota bacterium]